MSVAEHQVAVVSASSDPAEVVALGASWLAAWSWPVVGSGLGQGLVVESELPAWALQLRATVLGPCRVA